MADIQLHLRNRDLNAKQKARKQSSALLVASPDTRVKRAELPNVLTYAQPIY